MFKLIRVWMWPVWLAMGLAVSISLFRRELDYTHPPAKIAGLLTLAAAMGVWIWLRRRWPRAELFVLACAAVLPALIREPRATVAAMAIFAAAFAFGRCACDWLGLTLRGRVEEIVVSAGLGLAGWILALMALAAAHLFYGVGIAIVALIALAGCGRGLPRLWQTVRWMAGEFEEPDAWTGMAMFAVLVGIGSVHLVMLAPSLYYDAYATHLASARYFALHHTLAPMPFLAYSWFPQGFELMMGALEVFAGQAGAQMIAPVFLMLNLLALYAIARDLGAGRAVAVAGAAMATAIPFVEWTGASAKNDLVLSFFLLAALLALLRGLAMGSRGWLYAAALAGGAALDVKLSALIYLPCLAVLYAMAAARMPRIARTVALSIAIFAAAGGYWSVRNLAAHRSILYPIETNEVNHSSAGERLSIPWRAQVRGGFAFNGQNETPCGLIFLLFLPGLLWIRREDLRPAVLGCVFFAGAYLVIGMFTFPDLRYVAAPVCLVVMGMMAGFARTLRASPWYARAALLAAMAYSIDYNWAVMATLGVRMPRIEYLAGRMSADAFLRRTLPAYASMAWIRDHAKAAEVTLSVGNAALAYSGDPSLIRPVWEMQQGPVPAAEIRAALAEGCCAYVVVSKNAGAVLEGIAATLETEDEKFRVFRVGR